MNAEERFKIMIGKAMYTESLKRDFIEQIKQAEAIAFEEGQREMRERSSEIADDHNGCINKKCMGESNCPVQIANEIRSLPLTTRGGESK